VWATASRVEFFQSASPPPPPTSISIQGRLQDAAGRPLAGRRAWRVTFYDARTGGAVLGAPRENFTVVSDSGRFVIELTPPNALFTPETVYYELAIDSNATPDDSIDPEDVFPSRVRMHAVPFARLASDSKQLGGVEAADYSTDAERDAAIDAGLAGKADLDHDHAEFAGLHTIALQVGFAIDSFVGNDRMAGANGVVVEGDAAYVAAISDSAVTILDVSNPGDPTVIKQMVDADGTFDFLAGASNLALSGDLLFVAAQFDSAVTIADVSDPANPTFVGSMRDGVGGFNVLNGAFGVTVSGTLAFIAAPTANAVTIANVSNPASPQMLAEIVDGVGAFDRIAGARSVFADGDLAYIPSPDDSALTIVDVSNPSNPMLVNEFVDGVGPFQFLGGARSVFVEGGVAYVAAAADGALTIVDVSNPLAPNILSVLLDNTGFYGRLGGARFVTVVDGRAFIVATDDQAVTVVDVEFPSSPRFVTEMINVVGGFDLLVFPTAIAVQGNGRFFIPSLTNGALTIGRLFPSNTTATAVSGRVGIGTVAPLDKLEVRDGNVRVSRGFFINDGTTLTVPDYVFDKGYELKSLGEVRAFIDRHGHLPGIPSAEEIRRDGLNLTQFQLKLLEKIEELTLHAMRQNEEIESLRAELRAIGKAAGADPP
jgi:hypothetical protein